MARRVTTPKRVLRRPASPRADDKSRRAAPRTWEPMAKARALAIRLLAGPRALLAGVAIRLAPFNPRAKRRLRQAIAGMLVAAHELQTEYATSQSISFATVYRLEAAHAALMRALGAMTGPGARPQPDNDRTRMASALLQVTHLAQVAREWQQDIFNLQHSLATETVPEAQRPALEAGMDHLQGYVQQNMHDLDRWLQAAEKLNTR